MEEKYGSSSLRRVYSRDSTGRYKLRHVRTNRFVSVSHFFRAFASAITGTLAAQAILKGVGVGDESATVLAATFTWLLKDGTGMMGRIMFAWLQGTHLDSDAKRWRLFADIINDLAIFLEILGPNFPGLFTFILCTSGVLKSIVGVAGGATRAALTQHQARRNNMADVSAKDGSQETLVNLAALICSLLLVPIVTGRHMLIWSLYFVFTSLHLYANYSAVKGVVMETMNQARLNLLLQEYFSSGTVLSSPAVNSREPVLWSTKRKFRIYLGSSMNNLCKSNVDVDRLSSIYQNRRYILWLNREQNEIHIALHNSSDHIDQLQACYHAELLNFCVENLHNAQNLNTSLRMIISAYKEGDLQVLGTSQQYVEKTFEQFVEDISRQRWKTNICLLCADEWRIV